MVHRTDQWHCCSIFWRFCVHISAQREAALIVIGVVLLRPSRLVLGY